MKNKLGDLLCEISGDINKYFTAKCFMTDKTEIEIFDEKEDIDNLRNYCKQNNYDIVFVKRKSNEISYIKSIDIEKSKKIVEKINTISREERININAQIPEIIDKFKEQQYVFVYDDEIFKGIITYADLNNPSLYSYLYILISDFEKFLRNTIKLCFEGEEYGWLKKLSEDKQKEIGGIFISNKMKGIELSLLECTTITQLKEVLSKAKLYNKIEFYKSKDRFNSKLEKIIECRNAIMHNRNLIKDKEKYDEFYEFLYDFCIQRKEINNYYVINKGVSTFDIKRKIMNL
jgi:hypothetical protein